MSAKQSHETQASTSADPAQTPVRGMALLSLLSLGVLGTTSATMGLWEPWESDSLNVALNMLTHGHWFDVSTTYSESHAPVEQIAALPYRWWPIAASVAVFGENEFSLRAPSVLLMLVCVLGIFGVTARIWGRRAGWFAALIALSMPLFIFHGRFSLGAAAPMLWTTLSALAIAAYGFSFCGRNLILGIVICTVASGLTAGLPGVGIPLAVTLVVLATADSWRTSTSRTLLFVLASSLICVGVGWLLAWQSAPAGSRLEDLLLWHRGLDGSGLGTRPAFNVFVHQIGIGLFPFGALLPLAFCDIFYPSEKSDPLKTRLGLILTAWFALSFIGPALGATYSHYAIFWGAPAVAIVLGVYFHQMMSAPPRPLFALASILLIALIDSNLKHNTQLLADTLISGQVDSFPPKLTAWPVARALNFALLGFILVYQGGFHRWCSIHLGRLAYPTQIRARVDGWLILLTAPLPLILWGKTSHLDSIIRAGFWPPLKGSVRRLIVGLAAWMVVYVVIRLIVNARVRLLDGRVTGRFQNGLNHLRSLLDGDRVPIRLMAFSKPILFPTDTRFWSGRRSLMVGVLALSFALLVSISSSAFNATLLGLSKLGLPTTSLLVKSVPSGVQPLVWLVGLAVGMLVYFIVSTYVALRGRRIADGAMIALNKVIDRSGQTLETAGVSQVILGVILVIWVAFYNGPIAHALTTTFTQKEIVDQFNALSKGDETVYRYRLKAEHRSFYTHRLPELDQRTFGQRSRDEARFFAIIPRKDLATVNRQFRQMTKRTLPVLYDESARYLLVSNRLGDGEKDRNPITRALVKSVPTWASKVDVNFDDTIQLVGWRIQPSSPRPGAPMTLHLFWKALKDKVGQWKIFVHIDAPGQRIHGDHYPVEGLFPSQNWRKGDIIHDVHRMKVKRTIAPAVFTVYTGWYQGKKRLPIKSGPKDKDNRARLGAIRIR